MRPTKPRARRGGRSRPVICVRLMTPTFTVSNGNDKRRVGCGVQPLVVAAGGGGKVQYAIPAGHNAARPVTSTSRVRLHRRPRKRSSAPVQSRALRGAVRVHVLIPSTLKAGDLGGPKLCAACATLLGDRQCSPLLLSLLSAICASERQCQEGRGTRYVAGEDGERTAVGGGCKDPAVCIVCRLWRHALRFASGRVVSTWRPETRTDLTRHLLLTDQGKNTSSSRAAHDLEAVRAVVRVHESILLSSSSPTAM